MGLLTFGAYFLYHNKTITPAIKIALAIFLFKLMYKKLEASINGLLKKKKDYYDIELKNLSQTPEILDLTIKLQEVEDSIFKTKKEMDQYNNPSNFATFSKIQRKLITIEKQKIAFEQQIKELQGDQIIIKKQEQLNTKIMDLKKKETFILSIIMIMEYMTAIIFTYYCKDTIEIFPYNMSQLGFLFPYLGTQNQDGYLMKLGLLWVCVCFRVRNIIFK